MDVLLFTDLDGTLLDHDDYSWSGARTTLARVRRDGIPLVPVTSKTLQEVAVLREQIGLHGPFVVENGGGAYFPEGEGVPGPDEAEPVDGLRCVRLGESYERIREFVREARSEVPMQGFGDMTDAEVAERTDLPLDAARRARRRQFTEPVILERPTDVDRLERMAGRAGLRVTRGGRFVHLMGAGQSKGEALRVVRGAYARAMPERDWVTLAAGDSPNDQSMLEAADFCVVIPHGDGPRIDVPGAMLAARPGSAGWGEAIARALDGPVRRSRRDRRYLTDDFNGAGTGS